MPDQHSNLNVKPFFKDRDWVFDSLMWLSLIGISGCIIGIFYFPVSILKYGFVWWNIAGSIVCLVGCCIPMIHEKLEQHNNRNVDQ